MEFCELIRGLTEIIDNNDNNLKSSYEGFVRPILDKLTEDANLLYQVTNRSVNEIKALDIKTFYTKVNLCKKIKELNPLNYENH